MSNPFLTINGEYLKAFAVFLLGGSLLIMITASVVVSQRIAQSLWLRWVKGTIAPTQPSSRSQSSSAIELAFLTRFSDYVERQMHQFFEVDAALTASEAKLTAVLDAVTAVITRFRVSANFNFEYDYISSKSKDVFGYSPQDLMADDQLWMSRVLPEDRESVILPAFEDLFMGCTVNVEYRFRHRDGSMRWIADTSTSQWDEAAQCWIVTCIETDITQRKQAEIALKQSEAELQALFNSMPDVVLTFDRQGRYLKIATTQTSLLYPPAPELLGKTIHDVLSLELADKFVNTIQQVLATQQTLSIEYSLEINRQDIWFSARVSPLSDNSVVWVARDISDRKCAEAILRQSETRFKTLVQNSFDIIQVLDQQFTITYENPAVERILGYPPKLVRLDQTLPKIHSDDLPQVQAAMGELFTQPEVPIKLEYRIQSAHGSWVWLESIVTNWLDDPDIGAIVANSRDITEHKQTEESLRQSEARNRAIISAIPDLLIQMNRAGTYLSVAKGSKVKLLGEEKLAAGINIHDIMPLDAAQERMGYVHQALQSGELQFYEYQLVINGETRDEEARIARVDNDEVLVIVRDITDRKQAERALHQSEATNRAIISAIPDLLIRMSREGIYLNLIKTGNIKLLNADRVATGASIYDFLPFDLAHERLEGARRALQTGKVQVHEYQVVVDGKAYDEEARLAVVSDDEVLFMVRDISDRKQAERALRQSEATNRAILSAIPDLLIRMSQDGTFLDIIENRNVKPLKPKHAMIGENIFDILPFEMAQQRMEYVQQALQTGELQLYEQQIEIESVLYEEEVRIATINDDEVLIMVRDISEQQAALRDRKRAEKALRQQVEREQAINRVIQTIRNSLDLTTVFSTAAREVVNLLPIDRVSIVKYLPDQNCWRPVAEYLVNPELSTKLHEDLPDQGNPLASQLKQLNIIRVDDTSSLTDEISRSRAQEFPGAWLLVRLDVDGAIWGSLTLMKIPQPSPWQDSEVELASAIADQLEIAIQQSQLYQRVQQLNMDLEQQVQDRTTELQQALSFEALLKRITDKVRDSLDENQILQAAVNELGIGVHVECCNAALYNTELATHRITHEYATSQPFAIGQEIAFADCPVPEVFDQLLSGQHSQFCFTVDTFAQPPRQLYAVLGCPLFDNQGVLGDLWLYKQKQEHFNDLEIRLVQQVANQCAIALRQSRLYQAEQAQVQELERLNHLKDDFLSTVSHELRTPMSNIKMATQMLEVSLKQLGVLEMKTIGAAAPVENRAASPFAERCVDEAAAKEKEKENRVTRYLQILREECYRETRLINDLLDLSRLDFGAEPLTLSDLSLQYWIPQIASAFSDRICNHQQQLLVEIPADLPPLTTDFNYLELILTELLHNACKYTPAGERIVVAAKIVEKGMENAEWRMQNVIRSQFSILNSQFSSLLISVCNSGVEIPPEELSRVFDKFYRVPNNDPWKHGGTGLGLTLIKKRVERIEGAIAVTSGQGWTTFTIQLPWSIET